MIISDFVKSTEDNYTYELQHLIATVSNIQVTKDNIETLNNVLDASSQKYNDLSTIKQYFTFGDIDFDKTIIDKFYDARIKNMGGKDYKTDEDKEKDLEAKMNFLEMADRFNIESGASKTIGGTINSLLAMMREVNK